MEYGIPKGLSLTDASKLDKKHFFLHSHSDMSSMSSLKDEYFDPEKGATSGSDLASKQLCSEPPE